MARERSRWNKDGRLPKSGTLQFRVGRQQVQQFTHPMAEIAKLAAAPDIIAQWRAADAMRAAPDSAKESS